MRSRRAPDRDFGAPGHRRRTGTGRRVICGLLAAIAAVTVGLGVRQDLQLNSGLVTPTVMAIVAGGNKQEMCLFHDFRHELPKGATFYDPGENVAHFQRLAELSTLWAVPEQNPAAARWRVAIVPGNCARIGLKVWRA
jgi:hypothetical protein